MKYAADFRSIARDALRKKWGIAVLVGLVAVLLGGVGADGPEIKLNIDVSGANASLGLAGQTIFSIGGSLDSGIRTFLVGSSIYILLAALVWAAVYLLLGSVVEVGYSKFNLELIDGYHPSVETLFSYFPYWKTMVVARLLQSLYVILWSLLFVIPGIIAFYSYAMTRYILAENPEMDAREAIALSKEMMRGNRWRLFCLQFSFIGWSILCTLTLGIGNLWLTPYKQAAVAAFYRDLNRTTCYDDYTYSDFQSSWQFSE